MSAAVPFTVIIDTREQRPFVFPADVLVKRATLSSGDYSLEGHETEVAIERKSLPDLLACLTAERVRFFRELERLRGYQFRALVVEATIGEIFAGTYRSRIHPSAAIGSVVAIVHDFACPVLFAESPRIGADLTLRLLRRFHERRPTGAEGQAA